MTHVANLTIDNTKVTADLTDFVVRVDLADMPAEFWAGIRANTNTHALDLESSSSQYASISNAAQTGLGITGDMTIECSVKFESLPTSGNTMRLVQKYNPTGNQRGYSMFVENVAGTYYLCFDYSDNGTTVRNHGRVAFPFVVGVKYHLATSIDVSTTQVINYVDGVAKATNTGAGTAIFGNTSDFIIGQIAGGSYVDGIIDEVRVWDDIRTAAEISSNMYRELVGNEANLVGYWKFNNNYLDETSNNNDLTASGSPTFTTDVAFSTAGGDIRIFKDDGTTELARDLVSCDISGETGELHFKYSGTLASATDTVVQVHADGTSRDYAFNETYGRNAVWTGYRAVFHMENVVDSTGNGYNLTPTGAVAFNSGKIGNGADYGASNSTKMLAVASNTLGITGAESLTVSLWWKLQSEISSGQWNIFEHTSAGGRYSGPYYEYNSGSRRIRYDIGNNGDKAVWNCGALGTTNWTYLVFEKNTTTSSSIFANGSLIDSGDVGSNTDGSSHLDIGKTSTSAEYDEVRVVEGVLSTDWKTTEYNNQNSPSTFYSVSVPSTFKPKANWFV